MPSVGLGEIAVLCDECRLVPEGQFGLVGYADTLAVFPCLLAVWSLIIALEQKTGPTASTAEGRL